MSQKRANPLQLSVTIAKTWRLVTVLITYYSTNTFMLWWILVLIFMSIGSVIVPLLPFKIDPFTIKYFNKISFFSNSNSNSFLFSSHTLAWLHKRSLNYLVCLFLSYLSHTSIYFNKTFVTIFFMCPLQAKQFTN